VKIKDERIACAFAIVENPKNFDFHFDFQSHISLMVSLKVLLSYQRWPGLAWLILILVILARF
jgi:hypothetical protein